jgi:hypothetical protein
MVEVWFEYVLYTQTILEPYSKYTQNILILNFISREYIRRIGSVIGGRNEGERENIEGKR